MEALNCLIKKARERGFISGFKVGRKSRNGVEVSALLYVDDIIIFFKAS